MLFIFFQIKTRAFETIYFVMLSIKTLPTSNSTGRPLLFSEKGLLLLWLQIDAGEVVNHIGLYLQIAKANEIGRHTSRGVPSRWPFYAWSVHMPLSVVLRKTAAAPIVQKCNNSRHLQEQMKYEIRKLFWKGWLFK